MSRSDLNLLISKDKFHHMIFKLLVTDFAIVVCVNAIKKAIPFVLVHRLNFLETRANTSLSKGVLQLLYRYQAIFVYV